MKYLRKFDSVSDMETAIASSEIDIIGLAYNGSTPVMRIKTGGTPGPDYSEPFYIDVRGAVTLALTNGLQMSTDGETWTDTAATTLSSGKTYFRVASDQENPLKPSWTEDSSSDYDIGGNINSLVKVNFENDTNCYSLSTFFVNKSKLKSAGDLILPATTLFDYCYNGMFNGCTSLTTAPALPATTLAQNCYQNMFNGCTNLNYIKCLATDKSASNCTSFWVTNVAQNGTFVKNPNMSRWGTGTSGIPSGWTVEDASE